MSAERIPIQNIYYLLCYAWNHLQERDYAQVRSENCDRIWDLMAKVLARASQQLVKRGVHRDYALMQEQRVRPKGKLLVGLDLQRPRFGSPLRTCEYDELSVDVLPNQIIRTTLDKLRSSEEVSRGIRDECRMVSSYFAQARSLRLASRHFSRVQLHRNMRHYRFVLDVCLFVHQQTLATDEAGSARFRDFLRDEASMGQLFQQFVRNFYAQEQSIYHVSAPHIDWVVDPVRSSPRGVELLPRMETDLVLQAGTDRLIIDCKFYRDAFQRRHDRLKFISSNLYQLFTYLKNQACAPGWENVRGVLLYPTVDAPFDETIHLHGHEVRLVAINLDQPWQRVADDLLRLLPAAANPVACP